MCPQYYAIAQKYAEVIERVHRCYIKRILNVKRTTTSNAIYGETVRFPLIINRKIRVVKYWLKLNNLTANCILKAVYNMLYNECENDKTTWVSKIRDMLNVIGFNFVWLYPQSLVTNVFVPLL